jgi:hypothetical protein
MIWVPSRQRSGRRTCPRCRGRAGRERTGPRRPARPPTQQQSRPPAPDPDRPGHTGCSSRSDASRRRARWELHPSPNARMEPLSYNEEESRHEDGSLSRSVVNSPRHSARVAARAEQLVGTAKSRPGQRRRRLRNGAAAIRLARALGLIVTGGDTDPEQSAAATSASRHLSRGPIPNWLPPHDRCMGRHHRRLHHRYHRHRLDALLPRLDTRLRRHRRHVHLRDHYPFR